MEKTEQVVLLLGSNIEPRLTFINRAVLMLEKELGSAKSLSSIYESEPWGFEAQTPFFNRAVVFETCKPAHEILDICLKTELSLGRERNNTKGYSSRTMDVDILYYGSKIINTKTLTIPHPRLHLRKFALLPAAEIVPRLIHPLLRKNQKELLAECNDSSMVKLVN